MVKRYLVYVDGRVQGVGFRGFCMRHALQLNLTGTVRNLENGLVEIQIQGEDADISTFLKEIQKGDRFIRVDQISVKKIDVDPKEKKFRTNYGSYW